jgi:glycosyltransferase involved in cell wall biosynthesis
MASSARSLRVAMVATPAFPSIGGIETHINEVAPRLAAAGADVTVLTTDPGWRWPTSDLVAGAQLRPFRAWPAKTDYSLAPGIYRAIKQGEWDLVHCQGYYTFTAPLAMRAAAAAGIPCIVTLHSGGQSSPFRNLIMRFQWKALRPQLARAERLVAVSGFEAEFFADRLRLPRDRFAVIPNGSNLPNVSPARPSEAGPLIVSVGRLERYKGHHRVLAAFPRVLERFPKARLRIAGSGPEAHRLLRTADALGIADRVAVEPVPSSDREGMASLLSQAALVVLLSEYESQSIAVHEALTLGRPVLVAYTSALRELADRSLAAAVPPDATADEIAAALIRQLKEPRIAATFQLPTWDDCASALFAVYQEIARTHVKDQRMTTDTYRPAT